MNSVRGVIRGCRGKEAGKEGGGRGTVRFRKEGKFQAVRNLRGDGKEMDRGGGCVVKRRGEVRRGERN